MSLVESELGGPTVFKDLSKLDFDYVPEELPGRDDEIRFLIRTFRGLTEGANRENALIEGPVGTGKTAMAKLFARDFASVLRKQGKTLETVVVNCRRRKTSGLAMLGILNHFEPHYPERGFGVGEMQRDLRKHLNRRDCHLLVILDEVDALLRADGSDLVYDLTRWNDETGPSWNGVSLILVSQHNVLAQMDPAARSTFKTNILNVKPYDSAALEQILQQRVDLAFNPGAVDEDSVCLIADATSIEGNARGAIEILWKAGVHADDQRRERLVAEDVRTAKAEVHSFLTESKLRNMSKHPLLALLSLARRLDRDQSAYATTGSVEDTYKLVCEEYGEEPRGHTMFWKYLKQLQDAGMILARLSGKGQAGTTQLISIPDAPAQMVQEKLAEILVSPGQNL
jgi:cell division control protein 6